MVKSEARINRLLTEKEYVLEEISQYNVIDIPSMLNHPKKEVRSAGERIRNIYAELGRLHRLQRRLQNA